MPNNEEHCQHSLKRYGVRGDDIHSWMDEPSTVVGVTHRNYRHDLSSLPIAIQLFGKIYGADMVENIFLDHLKADSEENRQRNKIASESLKYWSIIDDEFLLRNFLDMSDEELEVSMQNKSKSEIRQRRKYLGLIRPRIMMKTTREPRVQRIAFKLEKDQLITYSIKVNGSNNDLNFSFFRYQGISPSRLEPITPKLITQFESFADKIQFTGNYCFYFSNSFSVFTSKEVEFSYRVNNGREIKFTFEL
ncbi:MAG: hypothetical protein IAX22_06545 [Candidatus Bathyarchaeota archaeon]|nr:hypothetical protein [Candidatus Bathyarchaeota archaeon]